MNCRPCPAPPGGRDGGSGRGCFSATSMPWVQRGFLHLSLLRSRPAVLRSRVSDPGPAPTAPARESSPSTQSGRSTRPSRPSAGIQEALCAKERDGYIFPCAHFAEQYLTVLSRINKDSYSRCLHRRFSRVSRVRNLAKEFRKFPCFASLCCVWSLRSFHRSISPSSGLQELNGHD